MQDDEWIKQAQMSLSSSCSKKRVVMRGGCLWLQHGFPWKILEKCRWYWEGRSRLRKVSGGCFMACGAEGGNPAYIQWALVPRQGWASTSAVLGRKVGSGTEEFRGGSVWSARARSRDMLTDDLCFLCEVGTKSPTCNEMVNVWAGFMGERGMKKTLIVNRNIQTDNCTNHDCTDQ